MAYGRLNIGLAAALLAVAACAAPQHQPTNIGSSAAAPIVPGTGRVMGGTGNADIQRVWAGGTGAQAPIVSGTGRVMEGTGNADIQRTLAGQGVQAPIVRGTGQITGGLGNAEVQRLGGGPPMR